MSRRGAELSHASLGRGKNTDDKPRNSLMMRGGNKFTQEPIDMLSHFYSVQCTTGSPAATQIQTLSLVTAIPLLKEG